MTAPAPRAEERSGLQGLHLPRQRGGSDAPCRRQQIPLSSTF
jgi:hypothetical protein